MNIIKTRNELLTHITKNIICAELGVFEGTFSNEILQIIKPSKLYLVDIFTGNAISGDVNGQNRKTILLDDSYKNLQERYKNDASVILYKGLTKNFFESIENESLDFVYIDADHSYEGVKFDLEYSRIKVKRNGFISGHDYANAFPGVIKAVDEFCTKYNLEKIITTDERLNSFLIINK